MQQFTEISDLVDNGRVFLPKGLLRLFSGEAERVDALIGKWGYVNMNYILAAASLFSFKSVDEVLDAIEEGTFHRPRESLQEMDGGEFYKEHLLFYEQRQVKGHPHLPTVFQFSLYEGNGCFLPELPPRSWHPNMDGQIGPMGDDFSFERAVRAYEDNR